MSHDVADALVEQLEAEARFVDAGSFTLDARKAREKLAAHQLAEPNRFVLLLVEAAHLLPNCTNVTFVIVAGVTQVFFAGVELRGDELTGCFDAMFVDVAGLDPEAARRIRGRQRLALAVNAALGLLEGRVELRSMIAGEPGVRVTFEADGRTQTHALESRSTSVLVFEANHAVSGLEQRAALEQDARYAKVPIDVNGVRLADGSADILDIIEIRDSSGHQIGRVGWCAAVARKNAGLIALVANGAVVETYAEPTMPVGSLALVDADTLERDLSQAKFRRDEMFHQRVAAASSACELLSKPAPKLGPDSGAANEIGLAIFWLVCGFFFPTILFWVVLPLEGIGVVVVGLAIVSCWEAFPLILRVRRRRQLQAQGYAGIGIIERSEPTLMRRVSMLRVQLQVERPGKRGYRARLLTPVDSVSEHPLEPGERVYLRIDPYVSGPDASEDDEHVAFDDGHSPDQGPRLVIDARPRRR